MKEKLKEILSIPSYSGREVRIQEYLTEFAVKNGIKAMICAKGNVYLTKGKIPADGAYPCVVAHIDTVHDHEDLIKENGRLIIKENDGILTAYHPKTNKQTGIGGDDKCGVYVCLELLKKFDTIKAAFFVEEEIGMLGSEKADDEFFSDVGYAIQFDAPSANWITEVCSGVRVMDDEFKGLITENLLSSGYDVFSRDPFTDINQLAQKYDFNCTNLGCGYHQQHSDREYVVVDEVMKSVAAGEKLISFLGTQKYTANIDRTKNTWLIDRWEKLRAWDVEDVYDNISDDDIEIVELDDLSDWDSIDIEDLGEWDDFDLD